MKGGDVKMRKTVMVILILVAVVAMSAAVVYGGRGERGGRGGHRLAGLTEEQRSEVHELVSGMWEAGASRDEIHAAVRELLQSWGIEMPDRPEGEGHGRRHKLMEQLTEEQREAVHALVTEMREAGASRDEIHAAVRELLQSWGIEMPDPPEGDDAQNQSLISPGAGESATWGEIKGDFK